MAAIGRWRGVATAKLARVSLGQQWFPRPCSIVGASAARWPRFHAPQLQRRSTGHAALESTRPRTDLSAGASIAAARLDFDDHHLASQTLLQLTRKYTVLTMVRWRWLVDRSDVLLTLSRRYLGDTIVNAIVGPTFFKHFCGGTSVTAIQPAVEHLRSMGVGPILDFAAEEDVQQTEGTDGCQPDPTSQVFPWHGDAAAERNLSTLKESILAVSKMQDGFAAAKLTALGNPNALQLASTGVVSARRLLGGSCSLMELRRKCVAQGVDLTDMASQSVFSRLTDASAAGETDTIYYVDFMGDMTDEGAWDLLIRMKDDPSLADLPPLRKPSPDEMGVLKNTLRRTADLAQYAAEKGVGLMIDAEQTYLQPAIDLVVLRLQREHNRPGKAGAGVGEQRPAGYFGIFNTYQCYLKDTSDRLRVDLDQSRRLKFNFAAKFVRGAYMDREREIAKAEGVSSPIHETIEDTHRCYNNAVAAVIGRPGAGVMVASHNLASVQLALAAMAEKGLPPRGSGVFFAQLQGMSDNLTYTLGLNGYEAYKYLPYGPIEETLPYLVRRARENGDVLGQAGEERARVGDELWGRLKTIGSLSAVAYGLLNAVM